MSREILLLNALNTLFTIACNLYVKQPYMDEEFHLDQMLHYLDHDFNYWNPKLTTPPVLYILNYPMVKLLGYCGISVLISCRLINTFVYSNIAHYILTKLIPDKQKALLFVLLPTIYFYNFLFYTDTLSLLLILIAYYKITINMNILSGMACLLAIGCRQTNIIWTVYICVIKYLEANRSKFSYKDPRLSMIHHLQALITLVINDFGNILQLFKYHIMVVGAFLMFWWQNGGVALGDKANHHMVIHGSQLLYFSVVLFFYLPLNLAFYWQYMGMTIVRIYESRNARTTYIIIFIISVMIIYYSTYAHPFILSDNRHYTFYVWKNILSKSYIRYALSFVYALLIVFTFRIILQRQEQSIKTTLLIMFTALSIVPAGLIEVRYFTNAVLFFFLETKQPIEKPLTWNIMLYLVLDAVFMGIFVFIQFKCDFEQCRFMF